MIQAAFGWWDSHLHEFEIGGTGGFENLLQSLADPRHPRLHELREWIGRPYDPAVFDPGEFTENLRNAGLAAFDNDPS